MNTQYTYQGLMNVVNNLVDFLLRVGGIAVVAGIIWYGLKMALARGDEAKFSDAKKGLTWALIAAAVVFGAGTIIATVKLFVNNLAG